MIDKNSMIPFDEIFPQTKHLLKDKRVQKNIDLNEDESSWIETFK